MHLLKAKAKFFHILRQNEIAALKNDSKARYHSIFETGLNSVEILENSERNAGAGFELTLVRNGPLSLL